ncbi:MAG: flippase-like domain-containing protein [Candidatus Omnitrophica bacterium]|nr:flippase-like domain-containing protein [Candidatus Omnitrophota bacterium]
MVPVTNYQNILMNQTKKTNGLLSFFIRFGLSFLLLAYLFSKIDIQKMIDVTRSADLFHLGVALGLFVVVLWVLLWRWFVFIGALELKVPVFQAVRYYFFGIFGNLFLPSAIGGDIIKVIGLCKDCAQKPKVVASVLLDRLSGFASIVLISVTAYLFGFSLIDDQALLIMIVLLACGPTVVCLFLFNSKLYEFCCRIFNIFPKVKQAFMNLHYDILLLKDKKGQGVKAIAVSCLAQSIFIFTFYFTAKALHQDISIIYFLIFVPMICVAAMVPSIGGLGVREFGTAYFFTKVGMDSSVAVSMSLINFLFMVITGLLGGLLYVTTIPTRRLQHHPSDPAAQ